MDEHQTHFAGANHCTMKGLPTSISPDRPPKNCKDAMSREDKQEWSEALNKEYWVLKGTNAFKAVRPKPGARGVNTEIT
jgi:hypothetical protein